LSKWRSRRQYEALFICFIPSTGSGNKTDQKLIFLKNTNTISYAYHSKFLTNSSFVGLIEPMRKNQEKKALELALAIYRTTSLFPKGEALVFRIRKVANKILEQITLGQREKAIGSIKILLNYFQIAKAQKWTKEINFVILEREYKALAKGLNSCSSNKKTVTKSNKKNNSSEEKSNSRQRKILDYIENEKSVKGADIVRRFSEFSPRTIRNDLSVLVKNNLLSFNRIGRDCFYKKKNFNN
jgi:hypothetical protein